MHTEIKVISKRPHTCSSYSHRKSMSSATAACCSKQRHGVSHSSSGSRGISSRRRISNSAASAARLPSSCFWHNTLSPSFLRRGWPTSCRSTSTMCYNAASHEPRPVNISDDRGGNDNILVNSSNSSSSSPSINTTSNILRSAADLRAALMSLGDTPHDNHSTTPSSNDSNSHTSSSEQEQASSNGNGAGFSASSGTPSLQSVDEIELAALIEILDAGDHDSDSDPLPDYMTHGWDALDEPQLPIEALPPQTENFTNRATKQDRNTAGPTTSQLEPDQQQAIIVSNSITPVINVNSPVSETLQKSLAHVVDSSPTQPAFSTQPEPQSSQERSHAAQPIPTSQDTPTPQPRPQLRVNDDVAQGSTEWLVKRQNLLTASDLLKVLGIEPRSKSGRLKDSEEIHREGLTATCPGLDPASPRSELFFRKLGFLKGTIDNVFTNHGTRLEPVARDLYIHLTGAEMELRGLCTLSPQSQDTLQQGQPQQQGSGAWLGGSPDGLTTIAGSQGVLEIKCPYVRPLTDDAHWKYLVQIQALMEITDLDWAHLFVYKPEQGALLVTIPRDRLFWNRILPLLENFHLGHVVPAKQRLAQEVTAQQQQQQQQQEQQRQQALTVKAHQQTSGLHTDSHIVNHSINNTQGHSRQQISVASQIQPLQNRLGSMQLASPPSAPPEPLTKSPVKPVQRKTSMQLMQEHAAQQQQQQQQQLDRPTSTQYQPAPPPPPSPTASQQPPSSSRSFTSQQSSAAPPISASPWKVTPQASTSQRHTSTPSLPPSSTPSNLSTRSSSQQSPAAVPTQQPTSASSTSGYANSNGAGLSVSRTVPVGPLSHAPWVLQGVDKRKASLVAPFVPVAQLQETQEIEAWLQLMYANATKMQYSAEVCTAAVASFNNSNI